VTESLWGEFADVEAIRTPHLLLKEQASCLKDATGGAVHGHVTRSQDDKYQMSHLVISSPGVEDYAPVLVTVRYTVKLYPCWIKDPLHDVWVESRDEAEYLAYLGRVLRSNHVRHVIIGLMSEAGLGRPPRKDEAHAPQDATAQDDERVYEPVH